MKILHFSVSSEEFRILQSCVNEVANDMDEQEVFDRIGVERSVIVELLRKLSSQRNEEIAQT
jgi:GTP-sensing pleiotropic transcriptional regulator CodY